MQSVLIIFAVIILVSAAMPLSANAQQTYMQNVRAKQVRKALTLKDYLSNVEYYRYADISIFAVSYGSDNAAGGRIVEYFRTYMLPRPLMNNDLQHLIEGECSEVYYTLNHATQGKTPRKDVLEHDTTCARAVEYFQRMRDYEQRKIAHVLIIATNEYSQGFDSLQKHNKIGIKHHKFLALLQFI